MARIREGARTIDRHHGAGDLVRQAAEKVVPLRQIAHLRAHFDDELAVVAGLDLRELIGIALDELRQLT